MPRPRHTLVVREHSQVRVGEPLAGPHGGAATLEQAHLDALARFNDEHQGRFFDIGYRCVRFKQYVGILQVGTLGIEILPKLSGSDLAAPAWRALLLEMLRITGRLPAQSTTAAWQRLETRPLFDIYVSVFLSELACLMRAGLRKGYRLVEENQTALRGRLMFAEQLKQNLVHQERFYVRHPIYDPDALPNRVLGAALAKLTRLPLSAANEAHLHRVLITFPKVSPIAVDAQAFERVALGRDQARYAPALRLARLILLSHSASLQTGSDEVFAVLVDMNQLFEAFICELLHLARPSWEIQAQRSVPLWPADAPNPSTMRPDLIVRTSSPAARTIVLDTKWKMVKGDRPSEDDLRQMYVYARQLGAECAVLLYPSCSPADGPRVHAFRAPVGRSDELGLHAGMAFVQLLDGACPIDRRLITHRLVTMIDELLARPIPQSGSLSGVA